jgi:hypothetical protein
MSLDVRVVQNSKSLLATLRGIDITVPLRGVGRNPREHVERYVICRLLAALAKANHLTYPLSLEQRETPDFLIVQGNRCVGVELSEVIPKGYARYAADANKMDQCVSDGDNPEQPQLDIEKEESIRLLEPGHFRDDHNPKREYLRRLLARGHLTARPFYGNEPEQEWARFMASRISVKLQKLVKYEKFDENWLVLYDNLHLPSVDRQKAIDMLIASLPGVWTDRAVFDALFIESGAFIIKITLDGLEWLMVNDIWN